MVPRTDIFVSAMTFPLNYAYEPGSIYIYMTRKHVLAVRELDEWELVYRFDYDSLISEHERSPFVANFSAPIYASPNQYLQ